MTAPEPEIAIHEDDEGMRNLYPIAAREDAAGDMQSSIDAGERNRAPDGIGWTDVHLIASSRITGCSLWTFDERLRHAATRAGVRPFLPPRRLLPV